MKILYILITISIVLFASSLNAQWIQTNFPYSGAVNCLVVGTNGIGVESLFAGADSGGIFHSTDDGVSWIAINNGLTDKNVTSLAIRDSNIFAATYSYVYNYPNYYSRGTIFHSTNNGESWRAVDTSLTDEKIICFAINDSNIYAGTIYLLGSGGIRLSTNNGTSWNSVFGAGSYFFVSSLAISDSNVFAGTDGKNGYFARSSNNGTTWIVDDTTWGSGIRALAVSGSNIFAGTYTGIYLSTNGGLSWSPVNNGLPENVNNYAPGITTLAVYPGGVGGNYIFAGTDSAGVFLSNNDGTSWTNIGMTNIYINALAVTNTNLFVGADSGVWRRPLSEIITGVENQINGAPSQFILEQNFPNPFNPSTNIEFRIADFGFVSLKVYDVLGREVATLVNEEKPNGNYKVDFDGSNLSSGIYFYTLKAGKFTQTRKLVLMK